LDLDQALHGALSERYAQNRYRQRKVVQSPQASTIFVEGEELLNFCSNDYLGLANNPQVIERLQQAATQVGVGSGASHLVNGHSHEHHQLELELAEFTGRERALLFSTGYMANLGVINTLVGKGDAVFQDKLNHASLIDGSLLSSADFIRYRHSDMEHLQQRLDASNARRKLIVTDGVFSMDGDLAKLDEMAELAAANGAWVMVDDAHGFGCIGDGGRGSVEVFGLNQQQVPVLIGTLGKAFGTFGAFVAGSETLIESLIQFSRTYIYTTALPPAIAAATRSSLRRLVAAEEERANLRQCIAQFRQGCTKLGLELMPSSSPIQPIVMGSDHRAMQVSRYLAQKGCWVSAIRPPTVPEGTARLRVTFTAQHTPQQVTQLLEAFAFALQCVEAE